MTWWAIEVALQGADADLVAQTLVRATGHAVEQRTSTVIGYADDESRAAEADAVLVASFGDAVAISRTVAPDVDWRNRWRDGLSVRTVGPLRIGPSWLLEVAPDTVVIDPESAFGSGEHGSTRGALHLLAATIPPGAVVLDFGAGSGILSIAAAKLGARAALGIEVDAEAVPIAQQNAERNGVADRARFVVGDAGTLGPLAGPAHIVISNILRIENQRLLGPIAESLHRDGVAIFAGMEAAESEAFRASLTGAGFAVGEEITDAGWWSVTARAPRPPGA